MAAEMEAQYSEMELLPKTQRYPEYEDYQTSSAWGKRSALGLEDGREAALPRKRVKSSPEYPGSSRRPLGPSEVWDEFPTSRAYPRIRDPYTPPRDPYSGLRDPYYGPRDPYHYRGHYGKLHPESRVREDRDRLLYPDRPPRAYPTSQYLDRKAFPVHYRGHDPYARPPDDLIRARLTAAERQRLLDLDIDRARLEARGRLNEQKAKDTVHSEHNTSLGGKESVGLLRSVSAVTQSIIPSTQTSAASAAPSSEIAQKLKLLDTDSLRKLLAVLEDKSKNEDGSPAPSAVEPRIPVVTAVHLPSHQDFAGGVHVSAQNVMSPRLTPTALTSVPPKSHISYEPVVRPEIGSVGPNTALSKISSPTTLSSSPEQTFKTTSSKLDPKASIASKLLSLNTAPALPSSLDSAVSPSGLEVPSLTVKVQKPPSSDSSLHDVLSSIRDQSMKLQLSLKVKSLLSGQMPRSLSISSPVVSQSPESLPPRTLNAFSGYSQGISSPGSVGSYGASSASSSGTWNARGLSPGGTVLGSLTPQSYNTRDLACE